MPSCRSLIEILWAWALSHLDVVTLLAKGDCCRQPANAAPRDQHPKRIRRRSHRRRTTKNSNSCDLAWMQDVSGEGLPISYF